MMRRLLLVPAVVVALLAPAATAFADEPERHASLRAATYNIAAGSGPDGVFDLDRTAEAIADLDADVVGLQEVDVHWSERSQWRDLAGELAAELDMDVFFAPIYSLDPLEPGQPRREFGNAILSRHPIVYAQNHKITRLSTQDPEPEPKPMPGFPEALINADGAFVHVYDTHLDFREDPEVREMQVDDMLRIMKRGLSRSQILLGDFNARPDAPELAPLWDKLDDAWKTANGPDGGLTYPALTPDRRIDYVAVGGSAEVVSVETPQTHASDHLPTVAKLSIPGFP
ncbi:MAG: endonuclease/exonuclease/phosphatase family protein [Stackebrandtia sp.]